MSDARTVLMWHAPTRERDALLAVLAECDRLHSEEGEVEFTGVWYDALTHASYRVQDAIDKALGISDE